MKKITQIPVLAPRPADGHKGMFGKILIVGGSVEFSVGYGASFEGLAALLALLKSCASGVSVVNIDNGFGAAYLASLINMKIANA